METQLNNNVPDHALQLERLTCYRADTALTEGGFVTEITDSPCAEIIWLLEQLKLRESLTNEADLRRHLKTKHSESVHSFSEMKKVKLLTKVSDSVCQIRVDGWPKGTGFLLFDRFVLTNGHVIEVEELRQETWRLKTRVTAVFGFEDWGMGKELHVKSNVVAYCYEEDDTGKLLDFALLKLSDEAELPVCCPLLSSYTLPPTKGAICIVGHPDGGVKVMDPCFIIEREPEEVLKSENILHIMSRKCFKKNDEITYDSCFLHGSSGSPVFNESCELIGIHSGGYAHSDETGETWRVMEYALPMLPVLVHILKQAKEKRRRDVVKYFESHSNMKDVLQAADHLKDYPAEEEQHEVCASHMLRPRQATFPTRSPSRSQSHLLKFLHEEFHLLLKDLKVRMNLSSDSEVHRYFREEYDKSVNTFNEVYKVKRLMKLSNSVCQIYNNQTKAPIGTGFLFNKNYIITNAHVIGDYNPFTMKLSHPLIARFDYEKPDSEVTDVPVKKKIVALYHGTENGEPLDFAVLELIRYVGRIRLRSTRELEPAVTGGTCIIGHPGGGIKRLDICYIIQKEERAQAAQTHLRQNPNYIPIITQKSITDKWQFFDSQITYNSCFFHGSSGSPVFNESCKLIGVHTGGHVYEGANRETRSVIEYALPLRSLRQGIKEHLRRRNREDLIAEIFSSS